jgi:ectoine hydroxylase-related dioxygenase (phytanoyl-CoA dioxygenase family)
MLTDAMIDHFNQHGWTVVPGFTSPETTAALTRAFEAQMLEWARDIDVPLSEYLSVVSQWTNVWERNQTFREQLFNPRTAAIAAELIDCDSVRVFHDHLIAKPPQGGATIPWHRDLPNWPIREPRALSCWLALDDAPVDAGAMRFMPGGHRLPMTRSIDFLNDVKDWGEREGDAVAVPVRAGDAVFHHCLSWHWSPPNTTMRWRRAYVAIYLDANCTFDPTRAAWHPMAKRIEVAPGEMLDDRMFPILGGRGRA